MLLFHPRASNDDDREAKLRIAVAPWWEVAKIDERYPATRADVVRCLAAIDYAISPEGFAELIRRNIIRAPIGDGWNATDIFEAALALDRRRQWNSTPSLHDCKKTSHWLSLETANASDSLGSEFAKLLVRYDLRDLLIRMVEIESREARERLLAWTLAALDLEHGIKI